MVTVAILYYRLHSNDIQLELGKYLLDECSALWGKPEQVAGWISVS